MHMDPELRKNQSAELPLGRECSLAVARVFECRKLTNARFAPGFSKPWEQAGQVVYFLSKYSSCEFGASLLSHTVS